MRLSRHKGRCLRRVLLLVSLVAATRSMAAEPRIVAVGDIHGDYDTFAAILQEASRAKALGQTAGPQSKTQWMREDPPGFIEQRQQFGPNGMQSTEQASLKPRWEKVYIGPDNKPLPFKNDDQLLEFLRTGPITSSKNLGEGTTAPKKLMLENDGIRADAIFRYVDEDVKQVGMPIHDTYSHEPAAYELGRLLDIHNLYPAVMRRIEGKEGSVQLWVENTMTETKRKKEKLPQPNPPRWNRQIEMMYVWDALTNNVDRNTGNLLIDPKWTVWYIDHTRAFQVQTDLRDPKMIVACERHVWERLQKVSDDEIRSKMEPYLRKGEIDSLLKRREKLVAFIQDRIHKKGEKQVLFDWADVGGDPGYTMVLPE